MAKNRHENEAHPAIKTVDRDDDTFSFQSMAIQGEQVDDPAVDQATPDNSTTLADSLFSNGQLVPHAFHAPSDPGRRSISKDSLISPSPSACNSRSNSSCRTGSQISNKGSDDGERSGMGRTAADAPAKTVVKHVRFRSYDTVAFPGQASMVQIRRREKDHGSKIRDARRLPPVRRSAPSATGAGFFRSFVSACRECHALDPSMQVDRRSVRMV